MEQTNSLKEEKFSLGEIATWLTRVNHQGMAYQCLICFAELSHDLWLRSFYTKLNCMFRRVDKKFISKEVAEFIYLKLKERFGDKIAEFCENVKKDKESFNNYDNIDESKVIRLDVEVDEMKIKAFRFVEVSDKEMIDYLK